MKTFVRLGSFDIVWYAVLIMTGAFIAYYLSLRNLKKAGYKTEYVDDMFLGILVFGVMGARLWYVLFYDFSMIIENPVNVFMIRDGGLAIHGGIFLGAAFAYVYLKKRNIQFFHWTDAIVPNVMVAQALGRWGNFMNQEAYGYAVGEAYYQYFPNFIKNHMYIDGAYRLPTFLFESVLNVVGWILITQVLKKSKKLKRGDLTFAYLIWYGAIRFIIEGMRTDSLMLSLGFVELRIAQVISIAFLGVGLVGFYGGFKRYIVRHKPLILFDFDGTIMDTQQVIFETFKKVLTRHKPDLELDDALLYSFIGPTLYESFGRFFDEEKVQELVDEYRAINLELHDAYVQPMEGVIACLDSLKASGYVLGIVSSKIQHPIRYALKLRQMESYFDLVYGIDDYEYPKPNPDGINKAIENLGYDRSQVIYVGDSASDIEAGRAAGAYTIGYIFDERRIESLESSNPNVIIHHWDEFEGILKEDHEWTYNMI